MSKRKAANGAGTVERRGLVYWVQCSLPRAPGETKAKRKRLPVPGSETMTEAQAKREGTKIARDVRAGKIVFDAKPGKRGAVPITAVMTVRQVGESWTSGQLYAKHGAVDGLAPRESAYIDGDGNLL